MKTISYYCPSCETSFEAHTHTPRRIGAAGASAAIGTLVTRNLLFGLAIGGVAYWGAGKFDRLVERACPTCGTKSLPKEPEKRTPTQGETEAAIAA